MRALVSNAEGDSSLQGGSSITQQLAKLLFLSNERTIERKIKELFLSFWLEANYLNQARASSTRPPSSLIAAIPIWWIMR